MLVVQALLPLSIVIILFICQMYLFFFKKDAIIFRGEIQPQLHCEVYAREAYAIQVAANWSC